MLAPVDRPRAREWARDELMCLVQIPSYSNREHEIVDYLERRLRALDLPAHRQPVPGAADNLLISWDEHPRLLFTAHVDTIEPTWEWDGRAELRGRAVHGLGAQDDKGCVVACLLALLMARDDGVPIESLPIGVGLCVDEEIGSKGSSAMARELRPQLVIGAEGTELGLGLAEAGFVELWFRVAGRSVHGALREEGDNAIERALRLVGELQAQPFADWSHPLCGRNIPMVWEIGGGAPLNVVPDACDVHVDIRVVPGGPSARDILETCGDLAGRHDARVDVVEISEPFETPPSSPLATALAAAAEAVTGRRPAPFGMRAWTDAHSFVQLAASEAVVFGPGHLRDAHRPDERVDLDEVVDCARTFSILMARSPALLEEAGREALAARAAQRSP